MYKLLLVLTLFRSFSWLLFIDKFIDGLCILTNLLTVWRYSNLLTSAQRSAEVRALQRALSFYISIYLSGYVCLQFVVYASLILDGLPFHARKDFNWIDAPDKAIKQSRDLKYVLFLLISDLGNILYCAASCAGLYQPILLRSRRCMNAGACEAS